MSAKTLAQRYRIFYYTEVQKNSCCNLRNANHFIILITLQIR